MARVCAALATLVLVPAFAAQQVVNVGGSPNDGTGDTLRAATIKFNANFTDVYSFLYAPIVGPVTIASGSNTSAIASGVLTNTMLAAMPASTIKCNYTASASTPVDCTTSQVLALLGGSTGITSISLTAPSWLTVSGSPLSASGTLALSATPGLAANQFLATPNGTAGPVSLRSLVAADLPSIPATSVTGLAPSATTDTTNGSNITSGTVVAARLATIPLSTGVSGTLPAADLPALTGDVTSSAAATTLATVNSNVGTFGSASSVPTVTVNGKGLVTAVSAQAITIPTIPLATGVSGTLPAADLPALTGDVTSSAGSAATSVTGVNGQNLSALGNGIFKWASGVPVLAVSAPTGAIVGTSDTQTLTNKTISGPSSTWNTANNVLSVVGPSFNPHCDGVTDDTSALAAAITAAGATYELDIPCPLYIATPASITQPAGNLIKFVSTGRLKLGVGSISGARVINPGYGYSGSYSASVSSGNATLGTVSLQLVSPTASPISIVSGGTGCAVGDTLYVTGGTQLAGASVVVTKITAGAVSRVALQSAGSFAPPPGNPVTTTGGTCSVQPTFSMYWGLNGIVVSNGGAYSTATLPTIAVSGATPTSAGYVVAQGQVLTLSGQVIAGNNQVFTGSVNLVGPAQNSEFNLLWTATGNGTTDDTAAIQAAANTGLHLFAPAATYLISNQIDFNASGQQMRGQGRSRSIFSVASVPTAPILGYFWLYSTTTTLPLQMFDVGMTFAQPDTSSYSALTQYPPAIFQASANGHYERVRLTACIDGLTLPYGDRTTVQDLEASCFHVAIRNLDSYDSIRITRPHFWQWGLTANQSTLFQNAGLANAATDISGNPQLPVSIYSEHADDMEVNGGLSLGGTHLVLRPSATSSSPDPFTTMAVTDFICDVSQCINMSAGELSWTGGGMAQFTATYAVYHTGGKLLISGAGGGLVGTGGTSNPSYPTIYSNSSTSSDLLKVTGMTFDAQTNDYTNIFDFNSISAVGSAQVDISANTFLRSQSAVETNPIVNITGAGYASVVGNSFSNPTTGSGPAISVVGPTNICVAANAAFGRTITGATGVGPNCSSAGPISGTTVSATGSSGGVILTGVASGSPSVSAVGTNQKLSVLGTGTAAEVDVGAGNPQPLRVVSVSGNNSGFVVNGATTGGTPSILGSGNVQYAGYGGLTYLGASGTGVSASPVAFAGAYGDQALQTYSSGSSATPPTNIDRVALLSGVSGTFTLTMPASPFDGQVLALECDTSETLTISANSGQTIKGSVTACSTTQGHQWHYRSADTSWRVDY